MRSGVSEDLREGRAGWGRIGVVYIVNRGLLRNVNIPSVANSA